MMRGAEMQFIRTHSTRMPSLGDECEPTMTGIRCEVPEMEIFNLNGYGDSCTRSITKIGSINRRVLDLTVAGIKFVLDYKGM
jgi:hypothetical protein